MAVQEEIQEMATKTKTFKQFISPDLQGVSDEDLKKAREFLNPHKTPEEKKKMN